MGWNCKKSINKVNLSGGNMFKIKSINIKGFKNPNNSVDVIFNNEVSVLYGENGCGKTTLLKIIHAILSKNESILIKEKVQEVKLEYIQDNINENIEIVKDEKGYVWNYSQSDINPKSMLFGVNRGITNNTAQLDADLIEEVLLRTFPKSSNFRQRDIFMISNEIVNYYNFRTRNVNKFLNRKKMNDRGLLESQNVMADNVNMDTIEELLIERFRLSERVTAERVQKALFDTLSLAVQANYNYDEYDFNSIEFKKEIEENKHRLIDVLSKISENKLSTEIIQTLRNLDNDNEELITLSQKPLLCSLLKTMIGELKQVQVLRESINALVKIFNDQLSSNKELKIGSNKVYIELYNGDVHDLGDLSSGEKHLLTFLTLFIIDGLNRDILMIDEPEISLNIKWQRNLIEILRKITPDSQIIVATHSPSIAPYTDDLIELFIKR